MPLKLEDIQYKLFTAGDVTIESFHEILHEGEFLVDRGIDIECTSLYEGISVEKHPNKDRCGFIELQEVDYDKVQEGQRDIPVEIIARLKYLEGEEALRREIRVPYYPPMKFNRSGV